MTTTVMRDSIVGDQWIQQAATQCPVAKGINQETNTYTGDIITGPVRLAFCDLFTLPEVSPYNDNPKFGTHILFSPYADMALFNEAYFEICAREFPDHYDAPSQQYHGLRSPFRKQEEKLKHGGFTPGCIFFISSSKFKPSVVDNMYNPIVDQSKVYAGVWAVCSVSAYAYKDPKNKGIAFGLQSVMIIGDDTNLGGKAPDPKQQFQGVNITAPIVRPDLVGSMPVAGTPTQGRPPCPPQAGVIHATVPAPATASPSNPAPPPGPPPGPPAAQPGFAPPVIPGQPVEDLSFLG